MPSYDNIHPAMRSAFRAFDYPEQKSFRDGYTDHGDHGWATVEAPCPVCGEDYESLIDDDPGCPNNCPNQDGLGCDFCGEIYHGEACHCGGAEGEDDA